MFIIFNKELQATAYVMSDLWQHTSLHTDGIETRLCTSQGYELLIQSLLLTIFGVPHIETLFLTAYCLDTILVHRLEKSAALIRLITEFLRQINQTAV